MESIWLHCAMPAFSKRITRILPGERVAILDKLVEAMSAPSPTVKRPAAGSKRNAFVRTHVPVVERVISVLIVCLLAGIGIAIWINGKHFDPNLYSLRTDALKSTAATVAGKEGTAHTETTAETSGEITGKPSATGEPVAEKAKPAESVEGEGEEGGDSTASAPKIKGEPMEIALTGIKPMGETEFYSPDTLYEKIDGRAPAYLGFNFQQLRSRSFAVEASKGSYVDVYEYRMDSPVNAFGIFSIERDPKGKPLDFAPDGYAGEMGFFFRQGACYVQVIASDQDPKTVDLAKAIAGNRAKAIPADDSGLDTRRKLPNSGLIPESVSFVLDNAQGQAFLKNVFQATYDFEGEKLPFFLMIAEPQTTAAAYQSYLTFCGRFGKATELPESGGVKIFQSENFGKTKIIYQREGEIGGVFDAKDANKARRFVEQYLQGKLR
jgi:hypothetical protein